MCIAGFNEKGSKVEADVAMCPLLSLFPREENRDGDTNVPYALCTTQLLKEYRVKNLGRAF